MNLTITKQTVCHNFQVNMSVEHMRGNQRHLLVWLCVHSTSFIVTIKHMLHTRAQWEPRPGYWLTDEARAALQDNNNQSL
jgi:hypothetical protein